jgi:hypothetical protein
MPRERWSSERKDGARNSRRQRRTISWSASGSETLRTFIDVLTTNGCAVMFGRTTDGGALSLLVLAGNDKLREYITIESDILPVFDDILQDLEMGSLEEPKT